MPPRGHRGHDRERAGGSSPGHDDRRRGAGRAHRCRVGRVAPGQRKAGSPSFRSPLLYESGRWDGHSEGEELGEDGLHRLSSIRRRRSSPGRGNCAPAQNPYRSSSKGRRRCGTRSAPRSRGGRSRQVDAAQPFRALPEVLARDHESSGPPCSGASGSPSACVASRASGSRRNDRDVRRVALLGMRHDEVRRLLRPDELLERAPVDSLEGDVEAAPARDAVDVLGHLGVGAG